MYVLCVQGAYSEPAFEEVDETFQIVKPNTIILTDPSAYPQLPTEPNILIIFKHVQQSIMVIRGCLGKKNQNLNSREKSSVY